MELWSGGSKEEVVVVAARSSLLFVDGDCCGFVLSLTAIWR